jgi:hypothetical protein
MNSGNGCRIEGGCENTRYVALVCACRDVMNVVLCMCANERACYMDSRIEHSRYETRPYVLCVVCAAGALLTVGCDVRC